MNETTPTPQTPARQGLLSFWQADRIANARVVSDGVAYSILPTEPLPHACAVARTRIGPFVLTLAQVPPAIVDLRADSATTCVLVPMRDSFAGTVNGCAMQPVHLVTVSPGARVLIRYPAATLVGAIAFAHDRYDWTHQAGPPDVRLMDVGGLEGLRRIIREAFDTSEPGSPTITDRIAKPGQSVEWLDATLGVLRERFYRWNFAAPDPVPPMDRIDNYIDGKLTEAIYLKDIADAAGVSMRKLHNVVVSLRGLSFTRYLKLRRLWNAYLELLGGDEKDLIKSVALRNGFWHLGDFAREYTRQFGESPSQTRTQPLRSPAINDRPAALRAWLAALD